MDEPTRQRIRTFHQWVTFAGACLLILGALAAGYLIFFRQGGRFPSWLMAVARFFHRLTH